MKDASVAIGRAMRLDYQTITDSGLVSILVTFLFPLLFPLIAFMVGTVGALALSLTLTVGYWALSAAGLFVNTSSVQCGRLSALMPVTRSHQVVGRYLSAGVLGVVCLAEIIVQIGLLWLIDAVWLPLPWQDDPTPVLALSTGMVVGVAMAAFVAIVALEMPFYYAFEFTKASSWFWSAVFVVAGVFGVGIILIPDEVLHSMTESLAAMPGWIWGLIGIIGCSAAVAVSYAISRHIWLNKEL